MVDLTLLGLWRSPRFPAVGGIEDVGLFSPFQSGFGRLVGLQGVEVFEKKEPRCLLRVVEFAGATGVFPEDIVDVFESLFEHGWLNKKK